MRSPTQCKFCDECLENPICKSSVGGYDCTRKRGHDGEHVACGWMQHDITRAHRTPWYRSRWITALWPRSPWQWVALACVVFFGLLLFACTPTAPVERVCKVYGFSPATGMDTVFIVPCESTARAGR